MTKIDKEQQANIKGGDRCDRWDRRLLRYDTDSRRYARTYGKYMMLCTILSEPEVN